MHLVNVATRFSLAAVVRKKTPEVITEKIMTLWIGSGMGPPRKFLADNGGEFANEPILFEKFFASAMCINFMSVNSYTGTYCA